MRQHESPTRALAQADLVLLAADLLRRPGRGTRMRLSVAGEALDELLAATGFAARPALANALREAQLGVQVAEEGPLSDEFHRLFEGAMVCPANETAYVRRDKGAIVADICGFYHAFGFVPREDCGEKPDHLLSQLEFVSLLLVMHHAAGDDESRRAIVASALESFADSHLGEWIGAFADRLESATRLLAYSAAARTLREVWAALADAYQLPAPSGGVSSEPQEEPEHPYECGFAPSGSEPVEVSIRGRSPGSIGGEEIHARPSAHN